MYKVSDGTDIKERTPIILFVRREDGDSVLHIARRQGQFTSHGLISSGSRHTENITDCNRVFEFDEVFSKGTIDIQGFKTCTRCGTREDFDKALAEYHEAHKRYHEEYKARQKAEEEARQKASEEHKSAMSEFLFYLLKNGIGASMREDGYEIALQRGDYLFTITAEKCKDA